MIQSKNYHPPSRGAAGRQKQVGESGVGREVKQKRFQAAQLQEEAAGTTCWGWKLAWATLGSTSG